MTTESHAQGEQVTPTYAQTIDRQFAASSSWEGRERRYAEALKHKMLAIGGVFDNDPSDPFLQEIISRTSKNLVDQQTFHQSMMKADLEHEGDFEEGLGGTPLFRRRLVIGNMLYSVVTDAFDAIKKSPSANLYGLDSTHGALEGGWGEGSLKWGQTVWTERYGKVGGHKQLVFRTGEDFNYYKFNIGRSIRPFSPKTQR